jgi:hypothetical protein
VRRVIVEVQVLDLDTRAPTECAGALIVADDGDKDVLVDDEIVRHSSVRAEIDRVLSAAGLTGVAA